jgi:hypothetical protein
VARRDGRRAGARSLTDEWIRESWPILLIAEQRVASARRTGSSAGIPVLSGWLNRMVGTPEFGGLVSKDRPVWSGAGPGGYPGALAPSRAACGPRASASKRSADIRT